MTGNRRIAFRYFPLSVLVTFFFQGHATTSVLAFQSVQPAKEKLPNAFSFRFQAAKESVADEVREIINADRTLAVRVTGERFRGNVRLFKLPSGEAIGPTIELKAHRITALALSADGQTIATAIGNFSNDWGEVRIWNGKNGELLAKYEAKPNEDRPFLGEVSRLMFVVDAASRKELLVFAGQAGGR